VNCLALIEAKRDGAALDADSLQQLVRELVLGRVPDYQIAALLMAVVFRGMTPPETRALTLAMRDSGEVLHFPPDPRPLVDKHSTGGVGDKVSLVLAPLLAALGFRVPMISGRGLGITGGTLDKLEAIPGFRTDLEPARIVDQVQRLGVAMAGQTASMVPADRILYALRDVTGTVPSIPLITASILSKKLAEGLSVLVMDVKFGRAAFMKDLESAQDLARSIVRLAKDCGVRSRALITDMNAPLGQSAGNWLEVKEAVECLSGRGPADLRQITLSFAVQVLLLTKRQPNPGLAQSMAARALDSGSALTAWHELLVAQGADLDAYRGLLGRDLNAPCSVECFASQSGYVQGIDARAIGEAVRDLGGGRITKDSVIQPFVGMDRLVQPGSAVRTGDLLGRIHAGSKHEAEAALPRLRSAVTLGDTPPPPRNLVAEIIDG
jgi:pyrimidine-nucleoside phosphorylase